MVRVKGGTQTKAAVQMNPLPPETVRRTPGLLELRHLLSETFDDKDYAITLFFF
eukprot:COSAG02_NODE_9713_length_2135_cov_1.691552_2_plen_54_part_00